MMHPLNSATLVWDQPLDGYPMIPVQLLPAAPETMTALDAGLRAQAIILEAGQMRGTALDQLCEIAGRACYDSLGRGRTSEAYHEHLIEVNHGSVHEHAVLTFAVAYPPSAHATVLHHMLNRPGLFVLPNASHAGMRITLNLRTLREWSQFETPYADPGMAWVIDALVGQMAGMAHGSASMAFPRDDTRSVYDDVRAVLVAPLYDEEKWVSLFLTGSRGFSHELVRHKYRTAVSQRSTRYVDEASSEWVHHPLVDAYLTDKNEHDEEACDELWSGVNGVVCSGQVAYRNVVSALEPWLIGKGVDKFTARKQARGAARGYLGNALYTECVFSASVAQWKRMLKQRATLAADAEIRAVFTQALAVLKSCRYGADFDAFTLCPSPDGLGQCLAP